MAGEIIQETRMPMAQQSPRIDSKTKIIRWYYKDTFEIDWIIALWNDDTDSRIVYGAEDQILISFYIYGTNKMVYSFACTINKEDDSKGWITPEDDTVSIVFDKQISQLFRPGKYSYTIKYIHGLIPSEQSITTISGCKIAEVEKCQ